MEAAENGLTRKELLRLGLLGGAAMVPLGGAALGGGSAILARLSDRLPESRIPRPFQVPFTVPPVAQPVRVGSDGTRFYQLTMRRVFAPILPGFPRTEIYGYDGISPGPTIAAGRGDVVIRHINRLPRTSRFGHVNATSVHLHGMATKPAYDGWADDLTAPGQYKDYVYLNTQRQRLLWYHDHAVHLTALNTYMGLAGFYLHDPDDVPPGAVAKLPRGRYMVPLMIGDKIFSKDGQLIFDDEGESSLFGDVILVNGRPWPVMRVERRKYTLGFLNASNSRAFNLALSSGDPFISVAHDSGLGVAPVEVESFRLGMAERYAMIVDFAKHRVGDQIVLEKRELRNNDDFPSTRRIMRFDVVSDATDTRNNGIPEILVPTPATPASPTTPCRSRSRRRCGPASSGSSATADCGPSTAGPGRTAGCGRVPVTTTWRSGSSPTTPAAGHTRSTST